MEVALAKNVNGFKELSNEELFEVGGGGVVAFVFAAGFVFGCAPVYVVAAAGLLVVGVGVGIAYAVSN